MTSSWPDSITTGVGLGSGGGVGAGVVEGEGVPGAENPVAVGCTGVAVLALDGLVAVATRVAVGAGFRFGVGGIVASAVGAR
ncbi:MAG: hypothetical protein O3B04_06890 [Chloroflexi bacterium]|nr:hypothetical protein [Chloroflexota bacterium]